MNQYVFNFDTPMASDGLLEGLRRLYNTRYPVIVCVGSDLSVGDSLGPIIGSELKYKLKGKAYVYGTLESPITALEINVLIKTINKLHPKSKILVVDAAVGKSGDVGVIKLSDVGIKPGLGVNKDFNEIGDVSIIAIVAEKTEKDLGLLIGTRLNLVKKISNVIISSLCQYFN